MPTYHLDVVHRDTGDEKTVIITAATEEEARDRVAEWGYLVGEVRSSQEDENGPEPETGTSMEGGSVTRRALFRTYVLIAASAGFLCILAILFPRWSTEVPTGHGWMVGSVWIKEDSRRDFRDLSPIPFVAMPTPGEFSARSFLFARPPSPERLVAIDAPPPIELGETMERVWYPRQPYASTPITDQASVTSVFIGPPHRIEVRARWDLVAAEIAVILLAAGIACGGVFFPGR